MKIACLAWGSLLWKAEPLVLATPWYPDGPALPLEFCRVADGGELATALCEGAAEQSSWWALLETDSLALAREQLRQREQIDIERPEWVGSIPFTTTFAYDETIRQWMTQQGLNAVVWTALPPRFGGVEGQAPDASQAVEYLGGLTGEVGAHAEDYVRRVPARLDTATRREIGHRLGWTPKPED